MSASPTAAYTIGALRQTPIGPVSLAVGPLGLARVWFGQPEALAAQTGGQSGKSAALEQALEQLRAYFSGSLRAFDLPLDLAGRSDFSLRVLRACAAIPFGQTRSYAALAAESGSPGAARAVGTVMAANRLPIVIPCHRVLTSGGRLGGYSAPGGLESKTKLLALEGIAIVNQRLA